MVIGGGLVVRMMVMVATLVEESIDVHTISDWTITSIARFKLEEQSIDDHSTRNWTNDIIETS